MDRIRRSAAIVGLAALAACGISKPPRADVGSAISDATYGVVPAPERPESASAPTLSTPSPELPSQAPSSAANSWETSVAAPAQPELEMQHLLPVTAAGTPTQAALAPVPPVASAPAPNAQAAEPAPEPEQPAPPPAMHPAISTLAYTGGTDASDSLDMLRSGDVLEVRFYRNTQMQAGRYKLAPGDVIRIDVVDHPEVSRDAVSVLPDGYISAPLIGSVQAAGKTVDQIREELIGHYAAARLLNPDVSVAVTTADQRLESLLRPEPGSGGPSVRITVSQAGYIDLPFIQPIPANRSLAEIQRAIKEEYEQVFGDRLVVTANLIEHPQPVVYVAGQVAKPTEVPLGNGLNPMSAVAAAGGFLPVAAPDNVHVIRFRPDGSYQDWKFDLDHSMKSGDYSAVRFQLRPQDVVVVPKSGVAHVNDIVEQYIRNMLPVPFSVGAGAGF